MARNVSRKKVLILGGIAFAVIVGAGALIYSAMSDNVVFFYSPNQVAAGEALQKFGAIRRLRLLPTGNVPLHDPGGGQ